MTTSPNLKIVEHLDRIICSATLTKQQAEYAQRLRFRLSYPVRVSVMGESAEATEPVFSGLATNDLGSNDEILLKLVNYEPKTNAFDDVDLAVWCSYAFSASEQEKWQDAPEILKDKSILAVLLPHGNTIDDELVSRSIDEFDLVMPLPLGDLKNALASLGRMIADRVRNGREADKDSALLLAQMSGVAFEPSRNEEHDAQEPDTGVKGRNLLTKVEETLQAHSAQLDQWSKAGRTLQAEMVLASCVDAAGNLTNLFETLSDDVGLYNLQNDVLKSQNDILLMSLEGSLSAATDAVATLVQLRKDVQLQLAA